jgi:Abnormal spindle-like microcephaly-assoc'd, ASPM-SPD-2-Hydin
MRLPQSGYWSAFSRVIILTILFAFPRWSVLAGAQQLTSSPAILHFGRVVTGATSVSAVTLTNTGSTSVTVASVKNAPAFTVSSPSLPLTLAAGQSAQVEIVFAPTALGFIPGVIAFASNAVDNPLNVLVGGIGVTEWSLAVNPPSVSFGQVATGTTSTLPVVLTNTGTSALTISQDQVAGPGFGFSGLSLPLNLAAGQSFTFEATFSPQSAKPTSGALRVSSPTTTIMRIPLNGTGMAGGQLTVAPATMNFGSVVDGSTASQSGTITASGAGVTISAASSSNAEYSIGGLSLPLTIAAGQSAPFTVTFSPGSSGAAAGTLSFASNAVSTAPVAVAGTGIPPYSVSLSWDGSTSPVTGYNVYRGGKTGGPYSKISALDPTTSYTDTTVAAGSTYYYVTTAVNSSGVESSYSNQVQAVIP